MCFLFAVSAKAQPNLYRVHVSVYARLSSSCTFCGGWSSVSKQVDTQAFSFFPLFVAFAGHVCYYRTRSGSLTSPFFVFPL